MPAQPASRATTRPASPSSRASTLSGNSATQGGGIYNDGTATATITASTLSGNSAGVSGGGLYIVVGNVTARSTIIAGNASQDIDGGLLDPASSSNLIGTGGGLTDGVNGNLVGITDPLLGPLRDNGGPTWTMALLPGSPAIDAGDNAAGLATDQRGIARPQDGRADIGAFECAGSRSPSSPAATRPRRSPPRSSTRSR